MFWLQIKRIWLSHSLASRGGRPWQYCRQDNQCMAWNTQRSKSRNCSGGFPVLCVFLSDWEDWRRYDHFGIFLGFLIVLLQGSLVKHWFIFCFYVLVLNISTSAQLSISMPPGFQPPDMPDPSSAVTYFPYFNGDYLAVAASLNGGNVVATFVDMVAQWTEELGKLFQG